eukprot:109128-Chlamydomonas_euryale.AAC.1
MPGPLFLTYLCTLESPHHLLTGVPITTCSLESPSPPAHWSPHHHMLNAPPGSAPPRPAPMYIQKSYHMHAVDWHVSKNRL